MNNIFQMMNSVKNPQQFMQQIMNNSKVMQNPIAKNAMDMLHKGDNKGLEELARNMCKEKGINADDALKQIKSQFGM